MFIIFEFGNFSSFFANFSSFFGKYPNFGLKFWGSFRILKTTHKTGPWKDKDFSKKYTPMEPALSVWGYFSKILHISIKGIVLRIVPRNPLECSEKS